MCVTAVRFVVVMNIHEQWSLSLTMQMHLDGWETVQVHVREKRKWKKYPCAVRGNNFVQFRDNKVYIHVLHLSLKQLPHTLCMKGYQNHVLCTCIYYYRVSRLTLVSRECYRF